MNSVKSNKLTKKEGNPCKKALLDRYLEEQEIYNDYGKDDGFPFITDKSCYDDESKAVSGNDITIHLNDDSPGEDFDFVASVEKANKRSRVLNRRNAAYVGEMRNNLLVSHSSTSKSLDERQFAKIALQAPTKGELTRSLNSKMIHSDDTELSALRPVSCRRLSISSDGNPSNPRRPHSSRPCSISWQSGDANNNRHAVRRDSLPLGATNSVQGGFADAGFRNITRKANSSISLAYLADSVQSVRCSSPTRKVSTASNVSTRSSFTDCSDGEYQSFTGSSVSIGSCRLPPI